MLLDILSPARILFGPGSSYRLGEEALFFGKRALVLTGRRSLDVSGNMQRIDTPLRQAGLAGIFYQQIAIEPTVDLVDQARALAQQEQCEMVIGVGGGSVLDVAKATAGLFHETAPTHDFHAGREITSPGLPWIALPTTAGSGSEVTDNAVLINHKTQLKGSVRHETWMANVAIVDPIFSMSMPKKLTAQTGLDALTHAIESYTSRWANPFSDALSQKAILLLMQNIYTAYNLGRSREARENMSLGSLMAGITLNQVRVGAVHALAHGVGLKYALPHGLVCGILLPYVMEFNYPRVVEKYAQIAYLSGIASFSLDEKAAAERFIYYIYRLREKLGIPNKLGELGLQEADIPDLVKATRFSSSLEANPRMAKPEDLAAILEKNLV